jgi:hypothetical protein
MDLIREDINAWFIKKELALRIFSEHDSRVEGWFKGELLLCLDDLRQKGRITSFEREFTLGARGWGKKDQLKIDFRIEIVQQVFLCELKALCISQTYGTARNLDFYFRKNSAVGLWKDFRKLESLPVQYTPWIISFIYPSPSEEKWCQTLRKWADSINDWTCTESPANFPEYLYISHWTLNSNS